MIKFTGQCFSNHCMLLQNFSEAVGMLFNFNFFIYMCTFDETKSPETKYIGVGSCWSYRNISLAQLQEYFISTLYTRLQIHLTTFDRYATWLFFRTWPLIFPRYIVIIMNNKRWNGSAGNKNVNTKFQWKHVKSQIWYPLKAFQVDSEGTSVILAGSEKGFNLYLNPRVNKAFQVDSQGKSVILVASSKQGFNRDHWMPALMQHVPVTRSLTQKKWRWWGSSFGLTISARDQDSSFWCYSIQVIMYAAYRPSTRFDFLKPWYQPIKTKLRLQLAFFSQVRQC